MVENLTEDYANKMMEDGFHCSQCVMEHAAPALGLDRDAAVRMVAGLGGGLFRVEVCGAVNAASVALGVAYGFDRADPGEKDELLKAKIHELEERFMAEHGTLSCRELLGGYDCLRDEDDQPDCDREDPWMYCGKYCETAAAILDDLLPRE